MPLLPFRSSLSALRPLALAALLFGGLCAPAVAQTAPSHAPTYWVFFADKPEGVAAISAECVAQRRMLGLDANQFSDLPIDITYRAAVDAAAGAQVRQASRWLNAVSVPLTPDELIAVRGLRFVVGVRRVGGAFSAPASVAGVGGLSEGTGVKGGANDGLQELNKPLRFLHAEAFTAAKLNGRGVKVGITDCGFADADKGEMETAALVREGHIAAYRDFVDPSIKEPYRIEVSGLDMHGRVVMQNTGGQNEDGELTGLATQATYYLARTDHGIKETRSEEDNWVAAVEWLDSLGVRLVNTSLGYTDAFDLDKDDYTPAQMDGKTSVISRAAGMAVREKGMILVVAAGNEGATPWNIVSAPADAQEVISVAAVNDDNSRQGYSSKGPRSLGYIKPDVAAWSYGGTSYAAPIITGMVACMLQRDSSLTAARVMDLLHRAGHLHPFANTHLGHGVPQAPRLLALMAGRTLPTPPVQQAVGQATAEVVFGGKIPRGQAVIVFHKDAKGFVLSNETLFGAGKPTVKVRRTDGAASTTVSTGFVAREVRWE